MTHDFPNYAELPEWARERALERYELVQRLLAGEDIATVAKQSGHGVRTLERWRSRFKKAGFEGLIPKHGGGRKPKINDDLAAFIKSCFLQPTRPLAWHIYQDVIQYCKSNSLESPSYNTLLRYLRSIPDAEKVYHRVGERAWKQKFEPVVRRDFDDLAVNEIWCGDHREFDVFIFPDNDKRSKPRRPWLTAWMDLRSRYVVGWTISFRPNSDTIAQALRHGILHAGKPSVLYIDNGKDYRAHYLSSQKKLGKINTYNSGTRTVLAALEIETIYAWPYNARSKPIERMFGNIPLQFERYLPGWCGRDNKERPEKLKKELQNGEILPLREFVAAFREYLASYHATEHSSLKDSPANILAGANIVTVSERALDLLLMKRQDKTLFNDGLHLFGGLRYRSEELMQKIMVGERVQVLYDPGNIDEIVVMQKGQFICKVGIDPTMRMGASEKDMERAARMRRAARERLLKAQADWDIATDMKVAMLQAKKESDPEQTSSESTPSKKAKIVRLIPKEEMQAKEIAEAETTQPTEPEEQELPFVDRSLKNDNHEDDDEPFLFFANE